MKNLFEEKTYLLIVEDEMTTSDLLAKEAKKNGFEPLQAETIKEALDITSKYHPQVIFLDLNLPDGQSIDHIDLFLKNENDKLLPPSIVLITSDDKIAASNLLQLIKENKITDYISKPWDLKTVIKTMLTSKNHHIQTKTVVSQDVINKNLTAQIKKNNNFFIGSSQAMTDIKQKLQNISNTFNTVDNDSPIPTMLITGETGTGKDACARYFHDLLCPNKPFITVDATTLTKEMMALELFGAKKNSYTGADNKDKIGLCEVVEDGILFFDEIGEMTLDIQSKLLIFLESRLFRPIGSTVQKSCRATIITATNRNLQQMVKEGLFREDLLHRINTLSIHLPPLRKRRQDIEDLAKHYLTFFQQKYKLNSIIFSPEALKYILNKPWDGNIRALNHFIENLIISKFVSNKHLQQTIEVNDLIDHNASPLFTDLEETEEFKIKVIDALDKTTSITKAAKLLNISRPTLRYRMEKLGITNVK